MDLFLKKYLSNTKYKKIPLTQEGSDRFYIRVKSPQTSWVFACSPADQQKKFLLRLKEFEKSDLKVPKLVAKNDIKGFLLLEDLGDRSLEKKVLQEKVVSGFFYRRALKEIVKLQGGRYRALPRFSKEDFLKEILWTEKYLIKDFLKLKIKEKIRKDYVKEWKNLCKALSSFPYKPTHRDYHSRNLFIKDKKIYMIDFQDAGLFPRFYDVASLLYDVYIASQIKERDRKDLFHYFLQNSSVLEKTMTKKIKEEWSMTVIQRLFKACGSFAGFYCIKKQDTHLKYIKPGLKLLKKQLQGIEKYPAFLNLVSSLLKSFEVSRKKSK